MEGNIAENSSERLLRTFSAYVHGNKHYVIVIFLLVKAFLAKAKDEFQVKYDKPSQVRESK